MRGVKQWTLGLATASLSFDVSFAFPNAPADVPTWCGKPYMSTNHSLDPGGQFQFPAFQQNPLLYVTIEPRYSIFLEDDGSGSIIVDASLSHYFGQAYTNVSNENPGQNVTSAFNTLDFEVYNEENGALLITNSVPVNSTGNLFTFSFSSFTPRSQPYQVSIYGTSPDGEQQYSATTEIYVLPSITIGSAVKIDNLFGGLYVQNTNNSYNGWYSIFPVGFYANGGFVTPDNTTFSPIETYAAQGFNTINIVPGGTSYPVESLSMYWDLFDQLNLFNIYDMRNVYMNLSGVEEQVEQWKNRSTLLMWYTADEPDGWSYPLNSTKITYDAIKERDPYHPVSLVLNCQDYYYKEYSSGADIVFEDAYPVAINATYSIPWNTPCNTTYGDCGCDNCIGELTDVSDRIDDFESYQASLGPGELVRKPTWSVLQTFDGEGYWASIPSPEEVENMMMLSLNHGAMGITFWLYPSTDEDNVGSGQLGKVFQADSVKDFVFGTDVIKGLPVEGETLVDASAWVLDGKMLVGVANEQVADEGFTVSITLPEAVSDVEEVLYGDSGWVITDGKLTKTGMAGLEVSLIVLTLSS